VRQSENKKNAVEQPEKFDGVKRKPKKPQTSTCRRNSPRRLKCSKTRSDPMGPVCASSPCFSVGETIERMRTILN